MSKQHPLTISSYTLGTKVTFEERVIAAKNAGYEGIGLRAENYIAALQEGLHDEDILNILKKHNMKVTEVEYITLWADDERTLEQQMKEQICFKMCELFDVKQINCGLMENYSIEHTAQKLKELCLRAGDIIIGVEPMPYSGIPDLEKGWKVVEASGCDNAKIILDTWHWVRANQPFEKVIDMIPEDKIVSVQINDVQARPYAKEVLRDESMHDRVAPGCGYGDTAGFCKMLQKKGVKPNAVGVEVICDEYVEKGVDFAAKYTYDNAVKVLKEAWPEVLA